MNCEVIKKEEVYVEEEIKEAYFENYKEALREMESYTGGFWIAVFDDEISNKMTSTTYPNTEHPYIRVSSWDVFNGVSEIYECEDESCEVENCTIDAEGNHTSREEWVEFTIDARAREWFEQEWKEKKAYIISYYNKDLELTEASE